jgi:hypothetical protein
LPELPELFEIDLKRSIPKSEPMCSRWSSARTGVGWVLEWKTTILITGTVGMSGSRELALRASRVSRSPG